MRAVLATFFVVAFLAMLGVTIHASADRAVWIAAAEIWNDPWGRATLFDTYFAFLTVWIWMAHREPTWSRRLAWLVAVLFLGTFAFATYFLFALVRLGPSGSWRELFREVSPRAPA